MEYNSHHVGMDQLSFIISVFVFLATFSKIDLPNLRKPNEISGTAWFIMLGTLHQIIVLTVIKWRRRWYIRWRGPFLISHLTIKTLEYQFMVVGTPDHLVLRPLEMPTTLYKAFSFLTFDPCWLTYLVAGVLLPLKEFKFLSLYSIALYIYQSVGRCELEIHEVTGQGQRYVAIAKTFEKIISQGFMPSTSFPTKLHPTGVASLTEEGACVAIYSTLYVSHFTFTLLVAIWFVYYHTIFIFNGCSYLTFISILCFFFQAIFGYFLPVIVMIAEEIVFRRSFNRRHNLRRHSNKEPHPAIIIVQQAFLVPFQAAVTFHIAVLILQRLG